MTLFSNAPAKGWIPWGALTPFLTLLFIALPLLTMSALLAKFGMLDESGDPQNLSQLLNFLLFPFSAIGLTVILWTLLVERRSLQTIGLRGDTPLKAFATGLLIGIGGIGFVVATAGVSGGFELAAIAPAWTSAEALLHIGLLLLGFCIQASVEELVFRGWMFSALSRKFNLLVAVFIVSALFTFMHYSPGQPWLVILSSFLFSVFACYLVMVQGNVWGAMGWHAGWNWFLGVGFNLPITGFDTYVPALVMELVPVGSDAITGGSEGPEGSLFCSVFFLLASLWLAKKLKRQQEREAAS